MARLANMTRKQILLKTLELKIYNTSFVSLYDNCDGGQMGKENQTDVLNDINTILNKDNKTGIIDDMDDEDMKTGVMIFNSIALCQTTVLHLINMV